MTDDERFEEIWLNDQQQRLRKLGRAVIDVHFMIEGWVDERIAEIESNLYETH